MVRLWWWWPTLSHFPRSDSDSHSVSVAAADQQTKEWLYSNKVRLNAPNLFSFQFSIDLLDHPIQTCLRFNSVHSSGWGAADGDEWGHRTACVSTCRCQQVGKDWRNQERPRELDIEQDGWRHFWALSLFTGNAKGVDVLFAWTQAGGLQIRTCQKDILIN